MSVKLLVVVIIDFKRYPSKKVVVSVVVICRISKNIYLKIGITSFKLDIFFMKLGVCSAE